MLVTGRLDSLDYSNVDDPASGTCGRIDLPSCFGPGRVFALLDGRILVIGEEGTALLYRG